jgi:hypothetical protein
MSCGKSVALRLHAAILLMKRSEPLPLDLETYLIAHGIDVAALDAKYRN